VADVTAEAVRIAIVGTGNIARSHAQFAAVCSAPFFDTEFPHPADAALTLRYDIAVADGSLDQAACARLAERATARRTAVRTRRAGRDGRLRAAVDVPRVRPAGQRDLGSRS
jgi:hypothetical protein